MKNDKEPTFEQLMEKYKFHNDSVYYHAKIAQHIAKKIQEDHEQEARETNYFTEEFFEADFEEGNSLPTE